MSGEGAGTNPWARILAGKPAASGSGNEHGNGGNGGSGSITGSQGGRSSDAGGRVIPAERTAPANDGTGITTNGGAVGSKPDENGNRPDAARNPGGTGGAEKSAATATADGNEENGTGGAASVIELTVDGIPKKRRGRPPGSTTTTRAEAKPRKNARKKYSEDKDLMGRLIEGVKVVGDIADMAVHYGMGIRPGIWKLNDFQAEVFARILARKADSGNAAAIEQLENIVDWADYVTAAGIGIEKVVETVMEVKEHGVNPFFLVKAPTAKRADKSAGKQGD